MIRNPVFKSPPTYRRYEDYHDAEQYTKGWNDAMHFIFDSDDEKRRKIKSEEREKQMKAAVTAMLCTLLIFITLPAKAAGSCGSGAEMLTVDEILLMAKVMELENGCNSDLCLMLTGSVILNRRSSPEWPDTVQGVIYQRGQYADWTLRHIPTVKVSGRVMALALKLATCGTMDAEIIFQSMHPELGRVKYHIDTEYFATKK